MSIVHEKNTREEIINEGLKLIFTPKWEECYSWEEVTIDNHGVQTKIGTYYTDGIVGGLVEWIEYNEKSIVIFGKDKYAHTTYIDKAYDISTSSFVSGNQFELAEYYMANFKEKTKKLTYMKKTGK